MPVVRVRTSWWKPAAWTRICISPESEGGGMGGGTSMYLGDWPHDWT